MDFMTISPSNFREGALINDIKSAKWVERYQEPGEFEFRCNPYDSIRTQLALGTLVTHVDTQEVMIVEDHEINASLDSDPELIITGRSLFAFLENRIASDNNFGQADPVTEKDNIYELTTRQTHMQIVQILRDQITNPVLPSPYAQDAIPNVTVTTSITSTETPSEIVVKRTNLYSQVSDLLQEIDAGLKVARPLAGSTANLTFLVHEGTDQSQFVVFSAQFGELDSTRYFWSTRKEKNAALVMGRFTAYVSRNPAKAGLTHKMMIVDATDFDKKYTDTNYSFDKVTRILDKRAKAAFRKTRRQKIIETSISPANRYQFRKDYNIGDIVYIAGDYGVSEKMRVVEYAEFEDESGETGVPTVKALD